jgi:RHS repeat-associated protein
MRIKANSLCKFISSFLMGIFLLSTFMPATLAEEIVHFYHNDHLGSPLAMTDEDGNVVWRRDYKPFGQEIDPGGETTFNTHTYTGKEFDAETGLYYYGARYYDPVIGRFISVDPADANPSNPQSWNRYVYSLNNPYRYVDPDGKLVWDVIDIACFGYSVYRFADDPSWSTALDLGLDAAGLLPVVPALGTMKRAGTLLQKAAKADEVLDAAKVAGKRKLAKGARHPEVKKALKKGNKVHKEFAENVKKKPGWQSQPRLTDPETEKTVIPDAITPSGRPLELKPNTPSGRRSGQRQITKYERATSKKGKVIHYDR